MTLLMMMLTMPGEIQRLRKEMESSCERWEREKASLLEKLTSTDKDYKAALQQAQHDHQRDVARLTDTHVSRYRLLTFRQLNCNSNSNLFTDIKEH